MRSKSYPSPVFLNLLKFFHKKNLLLDMIIGNPASCLLLDSRMSQDCMLPGASSQMRIRVLPRSAVYSLAQHATKKAETIPQYVSHALDFGEIVAVFQRPPAR